MAEKDSGRSVSAVLTSLQHEHSQLCSISSNMELQPLTLLCGNEALSVLLRRLFKCLLQPFIKAIKIPRVWMSALFSHLP